MNYHNYYVNQIEIDPKVLNYIHEVQEDVLPYFNKIAERAEYHQARILDVLEMCIRDRSTMLLCFKGRPVK